MTTLALQHTKAEGIPLQRLGGLNLSLLGNYIRKKGASAYLIRRRESYN